LLFIFIRWSVLPPTIPVVEDQIEIDLGNDTEGFGENQPLVKGTPSNSPEENNTAVAQEQSSNDNVSSPDNNDAEAAPVIKNEKPKPNPIPEKPKVIQPVKTTAPQKTGVTMPARSTTPDKGNNNDEDNTFTSQGKTPGKTGDEGKVNGVPNGAATGGPRVTKGNRKITKNYQSEGDGLKKAKMEAIIKVSPSGKGEFLRFGKVTTNEDLNNYKNAIINSLAKIQFDPSDSESTVTVQFLFDVN
jgi:hypothetical protein